MYKEKPKVPAQWKVADDEGVQFVAIMAPAELEKGTVRIKEQVGKDAAGEDNKGQEVNMNEVADYLLNKLGRA
jgi:histidyl-tRNA synthetase